MSAHTNLISGDARMSGHPDFFSETTMHEPATAAPSQPIVGLARIGAAADAFISAIAGFALLAGARAFMFTALLGWREPVAGGAGFVVLALIGWLRWHLSSGCNDGRSNDNCSNCSRRTPTASTSFPVGRASHDAPCYNRSSLDVAAREVVPREPWPHQPCSQTERLALSRRRFMRAAPGSENRAAGDLPDNKETPC